MKTQVILDTSPLVALINRKDHYHQWVRSQWNLIKPPLFTCDAVITESCFLLQNIYGGQEAVMKLITREVIKTDFNLNQEANYINQLLQKYRSVPMSLADACLVRMSELIQGSCVFTLDSDFRIYRQSKNKVIPVIIPDDSIR